MTGSTHELIEPTRELPVRLLIHHDPMGDGDYVPPHWHRGIELSYTKEGHIDDFVIFDRHHRTEPGRILVVNSRQAHSVRVLPSRRHDARSVAVSIIFPYDLVLGLYPTIDRERIEINDEHAFTSSQCAAYRVLHEVLDEIVEVELGQYERVRDIRLSSLAFQVLEILLADFTVARCITPALSSAVSDRLQEIIDVIADHYHEPCGLSEIAARIPLSKAYLARLFKRNMGITVGQYLSGIRAKQAYREIIQGHGSFITIAKHVGFSGTRSMNRALRSVYGVDASQITQSQDNKSRS